MSNQAENKYKYVYEKGRNLYRVVIDSPTYNPATKKTTHHYVTVGKAKEKGGEVEFGSKYSLACKADASPIPKRVILSGEKLVCSKISKSTGLHKMLISSFGKDKAGKIESLSYYLLCTGEALSESSLWCEKRGLEAVEAPRISELLPALNPEKCSAFFSGWMKAKAKDRTICYDITSISTYSSDIAAAEYGYNRDHEKWLKQINLAFVTDRKSHLPLSFRPLNGSLSDSMTMEDTIAEFEGYGVKPYGMVMDRGFWKKEKLEMLQSKGIKFAIPVPTNNKLARDVIAEYKEHVCTSAFHDDEDGSTTFCYAVHDPLNEGKEIWAHLYYNPSIEVAKRSRFTKNYIERMEEFRSGSRNEKYSNLYDEWFSLAKDDKGNDKVTAKKPLQDIIEEESFGYWVLYTDMESDPVKALIIYRERGYIEAGFDDLKGATDMKRLRVHSDKAVYGRLFLQFCAQILRTALREKISSFDADTRKYCTSPDALLKRVETFSKIEYSSSVSHYTAATKGQRLIFKALSIDVGQGADKSDENETKTNLS